MDFQHKHTCPEVSGWGAKQQCQCTTTVFVGYPSWLWVQHFRVEVYCCWRQADSPTEALGRNGLVRINICQFFAFHVLFCQQPANRAPSVRVGQVFPRHYKWYLIRYYVQYTRTIRLRRPLLPNRIACKKRNGVVSCQPFLCLGRLARVAVPFPSLQPDLSVRLSQSILRDIADHQQQMVLGRESLLIVWYRHQWSCQCICACMWSTYSTHMDWCMCMYVNHIQHTYAHSYAQDTDQCISHMHNVHWICTYPHLHVFDCICMYLGSLVLYRVHMCMYVVYIHAHMNCLKAVHLCMHVCHK